MLSVLFCSVWRRMFCTLEAVSRNALSKVNKVWNVSSSFPCFSQFLMKNDGFQHRLGTTARKRSKQWAFRAGVLLRSLRAWSTRQCELTISLYHFIMTMG